MKITKSRWFQIGIGFVLLLAIIWLLQTDRYIFTPLVVFVRTLFLPFLLAGVLFYLCRPLTRLLERWHVPRKVAILLMFLIIIGVITLGVNLLIPVIESQFNRLIDNVPKMISTIQDAIVYFQENQDSIPDFVSDAVYSAGDQLQKTFAGAGSSVAGIVSDAVSIIFSLVVVPFILFYLLHDNEKFTPNVVRFFPELRRNEIRNVLGDMDRALASYIQGQLIVSACVGFILLIGYFFIGLDYTLLLALFGMVTAVIPFLGAFIGVIPAIVVAWFQAPIMVIYVIIVMIVAHLIESNLVSPQVMGRALRVHPLTIILLILVGEDFGGVVGMILIIPTYAVSKVLIQHGYRLFAVNRQES